MAPSTCAGTLYIDILTRVIFYIYLKLMLINHILRYIATQYILSEDILYRYEDMTNDVGPLFFSDQVVIF